MKKYEYVALHIGKFIFGSSTEKHREIIDEYASKGYRYVGFVPTEINNNGRINEIDLIFEIDC